ncbi:MULTISPECIES: 2-isopropylmalate synthase [unclassified Rhodococcus (in: high G+C Gram-positive bacteria)]|uniref:2-isopropylmalate synthase n=1 Tax=Rhodococcus sp. SJ-3 TaxID=3454628 RepID=UPI003F7945E8
MNAFDSNAVHTSTSADANIPVSSWPDRLPLPLRAEAAGLTWEEFADLYGPQNGPLRMGAWAITAVSAGRSSYEATLAVGASIHTASAVANGPVAGMTAMLHGLGIHLEILSFHQCEVGGAQATFLFCSHGDRRGWAMGTGSSATESTLRAMIAGANRLSAVH